MGRPHGQQPRRSAGRDRGSLTGARVEHVRDRRRVLQRDGLGQDAVHDPVLVLVQRDVAARGHEIDPRVAVGVVHLVDVVAVVLQPRGAHCHHVDVGGGVGDELGAVVAGRADQHDAGFPGGLQRLVQRRRQQVALGERQAHVDDVRAVVHGVPQGVDQPELGTAVVGVEHLQRHQRHARRDTLHGASRGDQAGDVRAVLVVVVGVLVAVDEVVGGDDVRGGERRSLDVGAQFVAVVLVGHPRVQDRDHETGEVGHDLVVVVDRVDGLEVPLVVQEAGVFTRVLGAVHQAEARRVLHAVVGPEFVEQVVTILSAGNGDRAEPRQTRSPGHGRAVVGSDVGECCALDRPHHQLAGGVGGPRRVAASTPECTSCDPGHPLCGVPVELRERR